MRRLEKVSNANGVLFLLRWLGKGGIVDISERIWELSELMVERWCVALVEEGLKEEGVEGKGFRTSDFSFGVMGGDVPGT